MIPILQVIDYTKIKSSQTTQYIKQKQIEDYKKCMDTKNKNYMSNVCLILKHKLENMNL